MKVSIGEDENDPVFVITDLLVHLAQEQLEKKASQVIEGEKLDLLIGNRPIESGRSQERRKRRCKTKCAQYFKRDVRYR